ncbi:MAG: hypothetical protein AB7S46_15345, partial [Flavobacteriaceae bacterium]
EGALGLNAPSGRKPPVLVVSSTAAEGFDALDEAVNAMLSATAGERPRRRAMQEDAWVNDAIRERFGRDGLARMQHGGENASREGPFTRIARVSKALRPS